MSEEFSQSNISEDGAKQLVEQLVKLGFFHDHVTQIQSKDDLVAFRKLQKDPPQSFSTDVKCRIVPAVGQNTTTEYYTQEGLVRGIVQTLETSGGRKTVEQLSQQIQVDPIYFQADSPLLGMLPSSVQLLGSDLVSASYWKKLKVDVQLQVLEKGRIQVLKLARKHSVPMDVLVTKCLSNMSGTSFLGDKELVSDAYMAGMKTSAIELFKNLKEPISVSTVCQNHGWDLDLVIEWISSESPDSGGELHVDSTSTATAMFLPHAYTESQNGEILDFVSTNGYMTAERAKSRGMPVSQMITLVKETYPDAVVMGEILVLENIQQNVRVAIQECETVGTIDLQEYLPAELVQTDIVQNLLNLVGFTPDKGVAVSAGDQALIISRGLIKEMHQKILPPLIQTFAKARAEDVFQTPVSLEETEDEPPASSANRKKGKARNRKAKNTRPQKSLQSHTGFIPLLLVAGAVLKDYPIFLNDTVEEDLLNQAGNVAWDDDGENSGILLIEFCKVALYTEDSRSKCDEAVRAELQRMESAKHSKAHVSRKDAAATVRSVEAAFGDAFVTVCYLVQSIAKFFFLASSSEYFDEETLEVLRSEFLQGCCSDLTSRLTQYCMFKNEEDVLFTFKPPDEDKESDDTEQPSLLPACCKPVDPAVRRYNRSFLSCPPPREPLPVLRESLPGNMGVTLARQWVLCGGDCYLGGVRKSEEDGSIYTRPGNVEGFLSHVEENCL